jgi:integrase
VPVNDRLMPMLVEAKAGAMTEYVIEYHGKPVASIKKGIETASVRSGVHCHAHMFRHSAAVWMAEARVPMEEIAAFLGHRNIQMTVRVYAGYNHDYLRRAARELDW